MNERIKELALQSGFHFYDLHDVDGEDLGETVEADSWSAIDKFAELIVRECAEQIIIKGTDWIDWMPSQMGVSPEYYDMAQHIKTHFGIEE